MKHIGMILSGVLACLVGVRMAGAAGTLKPVALSGEGVIVGAAFSSDSSRLAIMRNVATPGSSGQRHVLQIIELKSGQEIAHADVLGTESATLAPNAYFIAYSPDARYLLLTTKGSDVLSILDATSLQPMKQIVLHPEADSRTSLREGHRYFRGVISLAVPFKEGSFGALTHDELQGNEVFIGSFYAGQIIKSWALGQGRTATQLGQTCLSLSEETTRKQPSPYCLERTAYRKASTIFCSTTQAAERW